MGKEPAATKAQQVGEEIRQFAVQLRQKVYGGQACPDWGTLFTEIEELACRSVMPCVANLSSSRSANKPRWGSRAARSIDAPPAMARWNPVTRSRDPC